MTRSMFAWLGMTALVLVAAANAIAMLMLPAFRSSLVLGLLAETPLSALTHFAGGAVAIASGALQVNSRFRNRFIGAHRWIGRLYVVAVVLGGVSGFVLAVHSSGGSVVQVGFALLAVCWVGCTLNAYRYIRQGNVRAHRSWMIRSYALTLAAVTLRVYLPSSQIAGLPMAAAYAAIAWLCWVPNLLV